MATLKSQTDIIAALEKKKKQLQAAKEKGNKLAITKFTKQINELKKGIKTGKTVKDVSAKQLANSLLASRKKFLEMSKKDFNGVIRQLSKKPEYSFLKAYTRDEVIRDIQRKAKPVGWRFKGRGNYKTPTKKQVRERRGIDVYYENRPNRSDVSQARQLAKGGGVSFRGRDNDKIKVGSIVQYANSNSVYEAEVIAIKPSIFEKNLGLQEATIKWLDNGKTEMAYVEDLMLSKSGSSYAKGGNTDNFKYAIIVTNTNNPYDNQSRVATVGRKGDAIIMLSALQMAAKNAPLDYSIVELYADGGFVPMSMAELERQRMSEYENYGGEGSEEDLDDGVTRQYFEDEAYSYEDGGEIDINDLDIPVHYTMFEDEMYEYGKGGIISVGDKVQVRNSGKTMEVKSISKNSKGQVEFSGSAGKYLIGDLKKV